MTDNGTLIKAIEPGSIAEELELEPGDCLLSINGVKPVDYIEYLMVSADEEITLEIYKTKAETVETIEFDKEPEESLGLVFDNAVFDGIRECANHCLFCFVHQLPPGQRESLYIRDDDYRLSFLQGAYVTLTNLTEHDWERIAEQHLSPLYISVHATDPVVRQRLLGSKKAAPILEQLKRLADLGITIHTQAVVCPGINDGPILEKTINQLVALWPAVASLAIVPVGLTGHRSKLFSLRTFNQVEASQVLEIVDRVQPQFLATMETRFVFAADEWYLLAGKSLPPDEAYEDYLQLDNGVGLLRWFITEFHEVYPGLSRKMECLKGNLVIITGQAALGLWQEIGAFLESKNPRLKVELLPVLNRFFGQTVTVTGLLTGKDIAAAIQNHQGTEASCYLIPQITLKQGAELFLDGLSISELKEACASKQVEVVPTRARDWLHWITNEGCVAGCLEQL